MTRSVRGGQDKDLEQLLELARRRCAQYVEYEPLFWKSAANAVEVQRPFFLALLDDPTAGVFVAVEDDLVAGFAIGRIVGTPPVYDPGGNTCVIDDFAVADDDDWSWAGPLLLDQAKRWAVEHAAVQLVVVSGHRDGSKRAALLTSGLSLASEWWTGPTGLATD